MRDFSWNYFSMTGDVDAYLLYKQIDDRQEENEDADLGMEPEDYDD
ncbi:YqzL family protein [Paenibacillus sp. MBLB4367]